MMNPSVMRSDWLIFYNFIIVDVQTFVRSAVALPSCDPKKYVVLYPRNFESLKVIPHQGQ